ncbi:MAG: transpeptidase family protein [Bacteroidales bacterium]|nr:transpeptidase family protein [Bacteroidales bacterium]
MSLKKDILWRVAIVYLGVFLLGLIVLGKILYLQFVEKQKWEERIYNTTIRNVKLPANRGDIYSSDKKLLASSIPYYEIRMDMRCPGLSDKEFYANVDSLAICLSGIFKDKPREYYKKNLIQARKRGNRFYLVKQRVNYIQLKQLKTFPIFRLGRYNGGFIYIQEYKRIKPNGNLASRTVGYTTESPGGNVVGIEGAYEPYLAGTEGIRLEQRLSGNVWMPVNERNEIEPRDGKSVITTIDVTLQDVAEQALLKQLSNHKAHHGSVVLMEVKTGEIKAIANLTDTFGRYMEFYNYAVGESTEPGSTFKLPALIALLEDTRVDIQDSVDTGNGIIYYYDKRIRDDSYEKGGYGKISLQDVFELSSNVGMAKVITDAYKDRPHHFIDRLYSMNLNEKLELEIKGEGIPEIKYPGDNYWSGVSLAMMSHGYEVRLTPLQILAFYNAVANNGKLVKPRFVKELQYRGKTVKRFPAEVINPSICSRSTLEKAKIMLEGVVEKGTASNLKNPNFKIAGKTGTTQIYNKKYGYKTGTQVSYQASFVGYFPADKPKYSCIVVINSPSQDVYYGNRVAGPVFLEIANKVYSIDIEMQQSRDNKNLVADLPYSKNGDKTELKEVLNELGIKINDKASGSDWVVTNKADKEINFEPRAIRKNLVPDVTLMGAKDALYLLENAGLKVEIKGRGSVRSQSIAPGTRVNKGQKIVLEMSFM